MNAKKPLINLHIHDPRWTSLASNWEEKAGTTLQKAAEIVKEDFSKTEVSLVLTNDQEVHKLNNQFRHKDAPTNVLSFPTDAEDELGDIILAYETIQGEASAANLPPLNHTLHLIIHGFLHLLGYDHGNDNDALTMETLEIKILDSLDIPNPYEVL